MTNGIFPNSLKYKIEGAQQVLNDVDKTGPGDIVARRALIADAHDFSEAINFSLQRATLSAEARAAGEAMLRKLEIKIEFMAQAILYELDAREFPRRPAVVMPDPVFTISQAAAL